MMGFLRGMTASIVYWGLAVGTFWLFYWLNPYLFYFYVGALVLMIMRHALGLRFWMTKWADSTMTSIDQHWNVVCSPILNRFVRTQHRFGDPDETASSVVGKNLRDTNDPEWRYIEFVASWLLEGGKPHCIPSIED